MNMKTISPLLLFSVFGLMACNNIKEPEFRKVDKFGLRNLSLQEATVGFEVTYHNPNNFGVTVKEAEADVYIDSTYLGKFIQDKTIDVSKTADFSIPFSGTIPLKTVVGMDLESMAQKEVFLKAEGSAKIGKAGIYMTKPINYSGRHRLSEIQFNKKSPD